MFSLRIYIFFSYSYYRTITDAVKQCTAFNMPRNGLTESPAIVHILFRYGIDVVTYFPL